jgi:hypothetical protein
VYCRNALEKKSQQVGKNCGDGNGIAGRLQGRRKGLSGH